MCTSLPPNRSDYAPVILQVSNQNTEAGLLTCSVWCAFPISQWLIAQTCIPLRERNLQQQVLSRILTGFPFHLGRFTRPKNHLHCKDRHFFVTLYLGSIFFGVRRADCQVIFQKKSALVHSLPHKNKKAEGLPLLWLMICLAKVVTDELL